MATKPFPSSPLSIYAGAAAVSQFICVCSDATLHKNPMERVKKGEKEKSKQRTSDHRCHFVLASVLDWTGKTSGEEVKSCQEPNQVQLLSEIKLWMTVSWMSQNLQTSVLALIITALSLSVSHTLSIFTYLGFWVCMCFWE